MAYSQADTLEKLERLTQLETMVAEQRIRIEKYKTMYETLKAEHVQLEDNKHRRETDISCLKDELQSVQERFQEILNQAKADRDTKIQECEELRMQILTPQKIEVLRVRLQEDIETSYKQKLDAVEVELDKYRSEFNKLRYDYSFLKSEYEHEQGQCKAMIEELNAQQQIEMDALSKDKEDLVEQLRHQTDPSESQRLRALTKENTQLNLKVRSLLNELDEIREQREASGLQSDHVSRLQSRQLSELSAQCKAFETEKESMKLQLERLQTELDKAIKEQDCVNSQFHKVERENLSLKGLIEELNHSQKIELNNIKLSLTKDRGELERDKDTLQIELQSSKGKIGILEQNLKDLKKALTDKEDDAIRRIQLVKEEEWDKISKLENYKLQAEQQLAENERDNNEKETMYRIQMERLEEKQRLSAESKDKMDKELTTVKSNLLQQKQLSRQLDEERERYQEMKQKHQKLMNDHESVITNDQENKAANEKLQDTIELFKKELSLAQEDLRKQQENFQRNAIELRRQADEEKKKCEKETQNSRKQLQDSKRRNEKLTMMAKKRNKKQKKEIEDLADQIQFLKAKEEKIQQEKDTLTKNLNLEHERTKRMLERMRKRQTQFNHILNTSSLNFGEGPGRNIPPGTIPDFIIPTEPRKESSRIRQDHLEIRDPSPIFPLDDVMNETLPT